MKKRILLLILICGALSVSAVEFNSPPTPAALLRAANPATPARYPNADVVLVEDRTLTQYNPDGSDRTIDDVAFKILTEKGRQEQSTVSVGYNTAYGSLKFTTAKIIKPNGQIVPIDLATQSRETIDSSQMGANIYDPNQKNILLSVPGLEIGDILYYSFRNEHTKAVVPNTWSDLCLFEESFPILHSVYQIDAPAKLPLARIELKAPVGNTVTYRKEKREDGGLRHTWEARNVPQLFKEPGMPAPYTVAQRVLVSTIPNWERLSKWYWKLSEPRLNSTNEAMAIEVKNLTEGLTDRQKKIDVIFRFVSQKIRYMGLTIENEAPGYEPHDVSLTFDNRYGVCRDKAALLTAMLRIAKIDAYPVLIYVGPKKDPGVPQPWFNHAITAVRNADGSWQLMDSTNENTRDLLPAYLCNRSYLVAHPFGEPLRTSPVIPPSKNRLTIDIEGKLGDDNRITANALLSFGGINDTAYRSRLAHLKPEEREPYFETRLKAALGSATLTKFEIFPSDVRDTTVPLSVALGFEVENSVINGPKESLLRMPTLINHFGLFGALLGNGTGLNKRRYPLQTEITCGVSETVRLDLTASSLRPSVLPHYETVDNPQLYINRSVGETNGQVVATADLQLRTVEFSPDEYLQLKTDLKTAERNARKRLILAPSGFPKDADYATLNDHTYYAVYTPNTFKKVHTVKQKVLTYAGKNKLSDIKLSYNSGVEQISFNYARVTAPDGTVREIDPRKEINIMDAPWVAGASRYPAGKIIVASLPGVDIGSTIEYQTVSTYTNVPFFSTEESFRGHNPIVKKTVQIEMPYKLKLQIGNLAPRLIHQRTFLHGENTVYEWQAENQPMIKKEDHLAPEWILDPVLFVSLGHLDDYAKLIRKTLVRAAQPTKALKAKAKELTKGVKGDSAKIVVLRDFVDRAVRNAGPGLSDLPLSAITSASQTLTEGYGTRTDRSVLLYTLLDAAKLKPRFILSSNLPRIKGMNRPVTDIFQRQPFNTLLIAVKDGKTVIYLGDSGQYAKLGTLAHNGQPAIDLHEQTIEIPGTTLTNQVEIDFVINIAENGDVGLLKKTTFSGTAFEAFHKRFAQFTPEELHREQQTLLSHLSQSAEATRPLLPSFEDGTLQLAANIKNYAVRDGNHLYLTLPEGLGNLLRIKTDHRTRRFYIAQPIHKSFLYEIKLPKGWRPAIIPQEFHTKLPGGAGEVEIRTTPTRDGLVILQQADINPALISVKDYNSLVDLTDRLTRPETRTILLRKK